tara:strand:- start:1374 stop:1745 length:372 start_codon:yes stop_codon:yes gene_type:complete
MSDYKLNEIDFYEKMIDNVLCIILNAKHLRDDKNPEQIKDVLNHFLTLPRVLIKPAIHLGNILLKDKSYDLDWMAYVCESIKQNLSDEFLEKEIVPEDDYDKDYDGMNHYEPIKPGDDYFDCI